MAKEIKRKASIVAKRKLIVILTCVLGLICSQLYILLSPSKYKIDIIIDEDVSAGSAVIFSTANFWNSEFENILRSKEDRLKAVYGGKGAAGIISELKKSVKIHNAASGIVIKVENGSSKALSDISAVIESSLVEYAGMQAQKPLLAEKTQIESAITAKTKEVEVLQLEKVELMAGNKQLRDEPRITGELARLEAEYKKDSRVYTERHPKMVANKKKISELNRKLTEMALIKRPLDVLEAKSAEILAEIGSLQQKLVDIAGAKLILPAISSTLPARQAYISEVFVTFIGIMLGLLLGLALVFASEHLDVTMDSVSDMENYVGLPVIGLIPHIERRVKNIKVLPPMFAIRQADRLGIMRSRLLFMHPKDSPFVESYVNTAGKYFIKQLYAQNNTFMFTSSDFSEGKSITCCNVALACAYLDKKTLIVEADMERPAINRVFDIPRSPGLTDCVIGNTPWRSIVKNVSEYTNSKIYGDKFVSFPGIKNLNLITFGQILRNNSELFDNEKLPHIIKEMKSIYDVVVFDCSPILKTNEAFTLAKNAGAVILVYQLGRMTRGSLNKTHKELKKNSINPAGVIVNDISMKDYYRILRNA